MAYDRYAAQVQLLVRILPFVADETAFALKGGTAINLFYRDMPRLIADVQSHLDQSAAAFLRSLIDGAPDFDVIGLPQAAQLPAVRWKVQNLLKLKADNPAKHAEQRLALEKLL